MKPPSPDRRPVAPIPAPVPVPVPAPAPASASASASGVLAARRLFIGLMPDPAVREAIEAHRRAWRWPPGARLTRMERVHLTLHFLGDVAREREAALADAIARVPMRELRLVLRTPQVWRRNGVAVLCPDPDAGLDALHQALGAALRPLGLLRAGERWRAHLSLARDAAQAQPPPDMAPIDWTVREYALVWSRLPPPAARYDVLARFGAPQ